MIAPSDPPRRRTQAERSSATRTALLEATIECLSDVGFANTTTTEIADRAGVSRGAQLHHFPTKRELVLAAIDHVLARRLNEFRLGFASAQNLKTISERTHAAVELLWTLSSSTTFNAWLELVVVARTDNELRLAVLEIARRFEEGVLEAFHEAFPEQADNPAIDTAPWFTLATLQGFALNRIIDPGDPRLTIGLQVLSWMGTRTLGHKEESE
jgi:AcrR family transcriptional regulator